MPLALPLSFIKNVYVRIATVILLAFTRTPRTAVRALTRGNRLVSYPSSSYRIETAKGPPTPLLRNETGPFGIVHCRQRLCEEIGCQRKTLRTMFRVRNLAHRRNMCQRWYTPPPCCFSPYADHKLKRATLHFASSVSTGRFVFDGLQRAIEGCLAVAHPGYATRLDVPGESAWRMVVDCSAYRWPFAAEIVYTIRPAEQALLEEYVPHFSVEFVNIEVVQLPMRKAA